MLWPGEGVLSATATFSSVPYPLPYKNVHFMVDLAFVFKALKVHHPICTSDPGLWGFFSQVELGRC